MIYCPGKTNIAEALSGQTSMDLKDPSGEEADSVRAFVQESTPMAITARKVEREPEKDPELCSVRYCIQSGDRSQCNLLHSLSVTNGLCTIGKLIMRGRRVVIPQSLRSEVLSLAHEGHQGIMKMKTQLRTNVWWPKIDFDVEKVCRSCQVVGECCPPKPIQRVEPPSGQWQDVAIDVLGPFPSKENLLVVDYYSRLFEVVVMRTTTSQKKNEALMPIFTQYGYPFSLKSDNAP